MMKIGITGHQRLDDPTAWSWVESAINCQLDTLPPPLIAVSSLAIGADQIFASLVARRGGQTHAVIPFKGYERTFSPHDVDAYHWILSKADSVEVLHMSGTDEEAYLAAGMRVVELSELMFTVWNGQPAKGDGGTANIVAYAIERRVPLVNINPIDRSVRRQE